MKICQRLVQIHVTSFLVKVLWIKVTNTSGINLRIIGGAQVDIKNFPYQVSMQYRGRHLCGGSILSEKFVVTAAHCTHRTSTEKLRFRAGSTTRNQGGQLVKAKQVHAHPKFNLTCVDYDIAIVEVSPMFKFNNKLKSIGITSGEPKEGSSVTASGWGVLKKNNVNIPTELRAVEIPVVSRSACKIAYLGRALITNRMICAGVWRVGGKDTCQGDSGGPLVSHGKLVGIVSWGFDCGSYRYPGVYTNLNQKEIRGFVKRVTGI